MWKWLRKQLETRDDFGSDPVEAPAAPEQHGLEKTVSQDAATKADAEDLTAAQVEADADDGATPEPTGDTRRALVNVFEYTYGALVPLLIFCALINFADPAQEVLIGFLADAQTVTQTPDQDVAARVTDLLGPPAGGEIAAFFGTLRNPLYLAVVALFALPVAAHLLAWWAISAYGRHADKDGLNAAAAYDRRVALHVREWIPLIALIGIGGALFQAMRSEEAAAMGLTGMPWPIIGLIVALVVYALLYFPWRPVATLARVALALGFRETRPGAVINVAVLAIFVITVILAAALAAAITAGFFDPHSHARLGPVALIAIFFLFLMLLLTVLTVLSMRMPGNFPLVLLLPALAMAATSNLGAILGFGAVAVALFFLFKRKGWAALPSVGTIVLVPTLLLLGSYVYLHLKTERCGSLAGCNLIEGLPRAPDAFATIDATLPHLESTETLEPLRIVAAQGGGLYAAYHTAYYLAARADQSPAFARTVYAISGVSGGSVGAGVFWAIETSGYCDGAEPNEAGQVTCRRDAVDFILKRDYLSAASATLLFADALDTVLPLSSLRHVRDQPPFERGRVLEREVERAVAEWLAEKAPSPERYQMVTAALEGQGLAPDAPLSMPISTSAWGLLGPRGDSPELAPLLFLNGTRVHDGVKVVAAPVQSVGPHLGNLNLDGDRDLSLINGMVMSARFPGVTPPVRVLVAAPIPDSEAPATQVVQLADGGYFDNSGLETALDIVNEIRKARTRPEDAEASPPKPHRDHRACQR